MELPAFMAHMANITYSDGDDDDDDGDDGVFIGAGRASEMPTMDSIWDGGTWTGSLIWDSAVRLSELFLDNHEWRSEFVSRLQERTSNRTPAMTVLELGCGLGLPSYIIMLVMALTHRIDTKVILTDRAWIADIAADGARMMAEKLRGLVGDGASIHVDELEWLSPDSVRAMKEGHLGGAGPDVIIGCDVVFDPLFRKSSPSADDIGGSMPCNPLLHVIDELAGDDTVVLLAVERRCGDGVEVFFDEAMQRGFTTEVIRAVDGVRIAEMRRRRPS